MLSSNTTLPIRSIQHPDWCKNATIYEVNTRQFSQEGNFRKVEEYIPQLKEMGIDIIWLMPIHPIGRINRKGTLGSYYAVRDYYEINPEYGDKSDFRRLVRAIHGLGMYIIIDWVANHTAWDHVWTKTNLEYFDRDAEGKHITEIRDWTDAIDLDFNNPDLRRAMTDAMKFWVREFDIDGFRCDVAAMIPTDFWNNVRHELDKIKPVFMLAEADKPDLHEHAFDLTHAWSYVYWMNDMAAGKRDVRHLNRLIAKENRLYHPDDFRMLFVTNHDFNSWNGTAYERLGDATEACIVFTCLFPDMPLVYNGQEAGMNKALSFFDKDLIPWQEHKNREIYSRLFHLKHSNKALWNGTAGGEFIRLKTTNKRHIFAFTRQNNDDKIIAVFNFSKLRQSIEIHDKMLEGEYVNPLTDREIAFSLKETITLDPWDYLVLVRK